MAETRAAGTIYDLGYQSYSGERLGRANAMWRLLQYSFRAAFGIGRGQRARLVPSIILLVVFIPVVAMLGVASLTGQLEMINFAQYLEFTAFLVALFAASQAPELVVPDRKNGVLALYLSRPLRGTDYALAKLGAIVLAMLVLTLVPQFAMWIGRVVLPPDAWAAFKIEYPKLLPIIGGTLGTALYMGSVGLAIASFCSRRAFANAGIIAYFLLLPAAVSIIHRLATGDAKRYIVLAHPVWLLTGFTNWLFDIEAQRRSAIGRAELPGSAYLWTLLGISAVFTALLLWRYRRSET
jgi:ABC-2 type transport system permease protein